MSLLNELLETQEFATLPAVVVRILELLKKDNIDVREVAKVVETDASLTIKILRVANSPLYAVRTEINSIKQAILILGLNRLTNIVLGVSIFSKFLMSSSKSAVQLMEKFWWHASCTGIVAKHLSLKLKKNFKEYEFIGGLLHDIGKLAMLQFDSDKYRDCLDMLNNDKISDCEAEVRVYGVDHLEVGAEIARMWKLPNELEMIIAHHNTPEEAGESSELVSVVRFADLLCEMWGAGINEGLLSLDFENESSWKIIKENADPSIVLDAEEITFELEKEFEASAEFLGVISEL